MPTVFDRTMIPKYRATRYLFFSVYVMITSSKHIPTFARYIPTLARHVPYILKDLPNNHKGYIPKVVENFHHYPQKIVHSKDLEVGDYFDDVFYVTGDDGVIEDVLVYDDAQKKVAKSNLYLNMMRSNLKPQNTEEEVEEVKRSYMQNKLRILCERRYQCEEKCERQKPCLWKCKLSYDKYDLC